jgi:hypothetical protein
MIRCDNCGTENLAGSHYCDECGAKLQPAGGANGGSVAPPEAAAAAREPSAEEKPPSFATPSASLPESEDDVLRTSEVSRQKPTSVVPRPAATSWRRQPMAKLVITRGGRIGREFPLTEPEALIGRWDADHGIFPDVDLDEEDPDAKVSRRHARIVYRDGQFLIEDLGSTNGTFINRGSRLVPGQLYPLRHEDEIIVGKTFLRFLIEEPRAS